MTSYNFKKNIQPIWCPGCGLFMIHHILVQVLSELEYDNKNTVVVSGIGCSGRAAGYMNLDSVHTTHGRAITVAEGIKLANPKLNVIVVSGDGDLLAIGGNHLIHTANRNTDIKIICNFNEIYGMTGGQYSPTTPEGKKTLTTPDGSMGSPFSIQGYITSNSKFFFARTASFDLKHMKSIFKEALLWKGFSFIKALSPCITNYGRRQGYKNAAAMNKEMKAYFSYQENTEKLARQELGFIHS